MFLPILCIHFFLLLIPLAYFTPFEENTDPNYKTLFIKTYPKIALLCVVIPVVLITYVVLFHYLLPVTFIDEFNKTSVYISIVIFTTIILVLLLMLVKSDMNNSDYKIENSKPLIIPAFYLYFYSSSILLSLCLIDFTNRFFDFSKGEEHICYIVHAEFHTHGIEQKHNIDIKPDIYGIKNIKVSSNVFKKIEVASKAKKSSEKLSYMTEEVKIKAYVYKGLYGVRYIGRSMEVLK